MKCLFAYPNKVNSPKIPQFPSFPIFCHVALIKRKKTSRFTIGENNHFVLGLLVRDIANHSYAQNTPLTQAWNPMRIMGSAPPGYKFCFYCTFIFWVINTKEWSREKTQTLNSPRKANRLNCWFYFITIIVIIINQFIYF